MRIMKCLGVLAASVATVLSGGVPQCKFQSQGGLACIGAGVDLTSFIPRVGAIDELKHHVVNLTCNKGARWTNPYNNATYAIWDQLESIVQDPSSTRNGAFFKFNNQFDFQEHFSESVSSGGLFGLFSASEEFSESFYLAMQLNASLKYDYGKVNAFVAMLDAGVGPSDAYLAAVEALPVLWYLPSNWAKLTSFFQQYGTHYIWQVALGGQFRYYSACEAFYLHAVGEAHADLQASLDFLFLLTADGGASGSASAAETAYQAACVRKVTCVGGNQASCNANSTAMWADYVASVDATPGLTSARYLLAADLLKTWHPIKHPVVRDATVAHFAWAGLEKLLEFYEATRAILSKIASTPTPICGGVGNWTRDGPVVCLSDEALSGVNFSICGTSPWTDGRGDPSPFIINARAWAQKLLNETALPHAQMTAALAGKGASAKVTGWLESATAWLESFKEMAAVTYSLPKAYACEGECFDFVSKRVRFHCPGQVGPGGACVCSTDPCGCNCWQPGCNGAFWHNPACKDAACMAILPSAMTVPLPQ